MAKKKGFNGGTPFILLLLGCYCLSDFSFPPTPKQSLNSVQVSMCCVKKQPAVIAADCSCRKLLTGWLMSNYEMRPPGFFRLTDLHRKTGLTVFPTTCQLMGLRKQWAKAGGRGA